MSPVLTKPDFDDCQVNLERYNEKTTKRPGGHKGFHISRYGVQKMTCGFAWRYEYKKRSGSDQEAIRKYDITSQNSTRINETIRFSKSQLVQKELGETVVDAAVVMTISFQRTKQH